VVEVFLPSCDRAYPTQIICNGDLFSPCKSLVERLSTASLAKNISKAIALLKYLWCQCTHELGKQFRAYIFHISAIESIYDPGDELSFFLAQF